MVSRRLGTCLVFLVYGPAALAQTTGDGLQLVTQTYDEQYLANPQVYGNLLVGMSWGEAGGVFDPAGVSVRLAGAPSIQTTCVGVVSKDGRYSAENLYSVPASQRGEFRVAAPTRYSDKLKSYPSDDMAVLVSAVPSCDDPGPAVIIPARLGASGEARRELVAYVNADPDSVSIRMPDLGPAAATCERPHGGVRIAYSARCVLPLPSGFTEGVHRLSLEVRERFKTVPTNFDVLLVR